MNFDSQLLFFFSALGAFNGAILSLYFLFIVKPKHESNYFLGGLLAMLTIRISKSIVLFFDPEISKLFLQIGLSACFLIGPFLVLYIKSKTQLEKTKHTTWKLVLIGLTVFIIIYGLKYPYAEHPEMWQSSFYRIINYQWLACLLIACVLLNSLFKKLFQKEAKLTTDEIWIISVYLGVFVIWVAYFTSAYTSYIVGALSFTFILYLSMFIVWHIRKQRFITKPKKPSYSNHKISDDEAGILLKKIEVLMLEEKIFKDPNMSLTNLSNRINISSHLLSQLLNDNVNKSFSLFINEYRILEAKHLLKSKSNLKTEVIAEQCGFNSNSTFYAAFKKITGMTPAKFRS